METKEKLAELNRTQAQALAQYYAGQQMVEQAEQAIKTINAQIQAISSLTANEPAQ